MAFAKTITKDTVAGDLRIVTGTYTSSASGTGGAIATGLSTIFYFGTDCENSQAATVNRVVISTGTATITTVADEVGTWIAYGQ